MSDDNPGLLRRLWTPHGDHVSADAVALAPSSTRTWLWRLSFFVGVPLACAGLLIYAAATTDSPDRNEAEPSRPCRRTESFVRHDPSMDPAGPGAEAVRLGGFLVTGDGADGSCVYHDS